MVSYRQEECEHVAPEVGQDLNADMSCARCKKVGERHEPGRTPEGSVDQAAFEQAIELATAASPPSTFSLPFFPPTRRALECFKCDTIKV